MFYTLAALDKENLTHVGYFMTVRQMATICGIRTTTLYTQGQKPHKKTRDSLLDFGYPFPDTQHAEDQFTGPVFILLNEKAKKFIRYHNPAYANSIWRTEESEEPETSAYSSSQSRMV